jgi:dTDP-4-dehydrorhamnose reductase
MKKKIVVTGGQGRFAKVLRKKNKKYKIYFPSKIELNILKESSIRNFISRVRPDYLLHCAALSRPMRLHDEDIKKSININIVGTSNVVKVCSEFNIKMIYFSTTYVYEGVKGAYKETDPVLPFNNYAWSKLGGECAVQMYKNSLILRIMMSEKPFAHNSAFGDIKTNFLYHDEVADLLPKLLDQFGVFNIGGKLQSIYNFAKQHKKNVKKSKGKSIYPPKISMNLSKLKKIL